MARRDRDVANLTRRQFGIAGQCLRKGEGMRCKPSYARRHGVVGIALPTDQDVFDDRVRHSAGRVLTLGVGD